MKSGQTSSSMPSLAHANLNGKGLTFTFTHLGRNGGSITFAATSVADRQAWMDAIENQRNLLMDSSRIFELQLLNDSFFKISNRVNCSVSYAGMIVVGTDDGLYVGPETYANYELYQYNTSAPPFRKIIHQERITQVDILPDYDMLIFLAGKY